MTENDFGKRPVGRPPNAERHAKQHDPVGDSTKLKREKREKVAVVDETVERAITVVHSTVIFRPNQEIRDKRLLEIAKANHIRLRYRE